MRTSVGTKGVESGSKDTRFGAHFHPDVQILRTPREG